MVPYFADVEIEDFFVVHRQAGNHDVASPVGAEMSNAQCPDVHGREYRPPRH